MGLRAPWRRVPDTPVCEVVLRGRAFLRHPVDGVLEVRSGTTTEAMPVYATVAEPRRWFVVFRGTAAPDGTWATILWEVDGATGQRALARRAGGRPDAAPVITALMDVPISDDPGGWTS